VIIIVAGRLRRGVLRKGWGGNDQGKRETGGREEAHEGEFLLFGAVSRRCQ
jgi:hypothetical protein